MDYLVNILNQQGWWEKYMDSENISKEEEFFYRRLDNDLLDKSKILRGVDKVKYDEYLLFAYLNQKRKNSTLTEKDTIILNALYDKYVLATSDSLTMNDFKGLSTGFAFTYPESKLNQLNLSHTLEDNKTPLLKIVKSFISAWDMIYYYKRSILKLNYLMARTNKITFPTNMRRYIILEEHLNKTIELYKKIFIYYTNYQASTKFGKYKNYMMIDEVINDENNLSLIKETINLANDLNYKNLKNYRPMEFGEVAGSPNDVEARQQFLEQDDSDDSTEDVGDEESNGDAEEKAEVEEFT